MSRAVLFQGSRCPWCDREGDGLKLCSSKPVSEQVASAVCVRVRLFISIIDRERGETQPLSARLSAFAFVCMFCTAPALFA